MSLGKIAAAVTVYALLAFAIMTCSVYATRSKNPATTGWTTESDTAATSSTSSGK